MSTLLTWVQLYAPSRAFHRQADQSEHADFHCLRELWALAGQQMEQEDQEVRGAPLSSIMNAHRPSRVNISFGVDDGGNAVGRLAFRWLLHEMIDQQKGYRSGSSMQIASVDVTAGRGVSRLEAATAIKVEHLGMISDVASSSVWSVDLGPARMSYKSKEPLHAGGGLLLGRGIGARRGAYSGGVYAMTGLRLGTAFNSRGISAMPVALIALGATARVPWDIRGRIFFDYAVPAGKLS